MKPVLDGEVDVAHGSRVLGEAEPNTRSRELGIVFFNKLVSFITRTKVTDCSNGYRAVRAYVLPAARPAPGAVPHLRVHDRGDQARHPGQGGAGDRRQAAPTATRRSRPWSATGWASPTRSSAPGCSVGTVRPVPGPDVLDGSGRYRSGPQPVQTWTWSLWIVAAARAAALGLLVLRRGRGSRRSGRAPAAPSPIRNQMKNELPLPRPIEPGGEPEADGDAPRRSAPAMQSASRGAGGCRRARRPRRAAGAGGRSSRPRRVSRRNGRPTVQSTTARILRARPGIWLMW